MRSQTGSTRRAQDTAAAGPPAARLCAPALALAALVVVGSAAPSVAEWPQISLARVITGLAMPVHITHAGDGSGRLFAVEQAGRIRIFSGGTLLPLPFLDIASRVGCCGERGLLSVAFPPGYSSKRYFYVDYTNTGGNTVVSRFRLTTDPDLADPGSEQVVLTIVQPYANHNGGQLAFGPDGYLYVGMGDGGSAGDPQNNAQNGAALLGKILRIDVESGAAPYAVPPSNPFAGRAGYRGEIWALGLRNPWRFSFDRRTGDLYIADVGQNQYEEIDFQPAGDSGGENYGWRTMEAGHCFDPNPCTQTGLVQPVFEYDHSNGCSVTGGFVYRGGLYPRMQGVYFFSDYCSGRLWGLRRDGSSWQTTQLLDSTFAVSTFGEDEAGNIYLSDYNAGDVYKLTDPAFTAGYTYRVPAVAHNTGAGGVRWRSDLAVVNRSGLAGTMTLTYASPDVRLTQTANLRAGGTVEWRNVLESLFGVVPTGNTAGLVQVVADVPLAIAARSYSEGPQGTNGQDFPALTDSDALLPGRVGILPQLRRGDGFYTNLGIVNLSTTTCTVAVRAFDASGSQAGSTMLFTVEGGQWVQQFDFLASVGAGNQDTAYATVEVLTPEGKAWAYAALIDSLTRDPTTVALVTP
jgi:glucose/arabinose dehydrogenase